MTKRLLASVAFAAGMSWLAAPTHAAPTLTITDLDTGDTVSVTDNGAGDLSGVSGHILFSGTVGQFFLGTESVLSNSGTASQPKFLTDNIHVTMFEQDANNANDSGRIQIVSEDTFSLPEGSLFIRDDFSLSSDVFGGDGTIDYLVEIDFGSGFQTLHSGLASLDTDDDVATALGLSNTSTYTIRHTYIVTAPSSSSGTGLDEEASATNTTTVSVPEPATLGLFGAGLLGLGAVRRRRKA